MSEGGRQILVVEDEAIVAADLELHLTELGYEVVAVCDTGVDAIATAERLRPDLVLMDIRLRGEMDGVEAAREIGRRLSLPVIYLTAYADADTVRRAVGPAAYGYLVKPFEARELVPTIEIALLRHRLDADAGVVASRFEGVLAALREVVVVVAPDGAVSFLNQPALRFLELTSDALRGRSFAELFELVEAAPEARDQVLAGGAADPASTLRARSGGDAIEVEVHALNDGARLFCSRTADPAESIELEALRRGIARDLGAVAARVADELRPQLESLRAGLRVLTLPDGVGPSRDDLHRRLLGGVDRMAGILRRLGAAEPAHLPGAESSLAEAVRLAFAECASLAAGRGVELVAELDQDLPPVALAGRWLVEALTALVEEALDPALRGEAVRVSAEQETGDATVVHVAIERRPRGPAGLVTGSRPRRLGTAARGFGFDFARRILEAQGQRVRRVTGACGNERIEIELAVLER